MLFEQLLGVVGIREDALDARLAVVEVAANAPNLDVGASLRDHLLALDVAYAAIGEQDADADAVGILKALERCLAGVARGGDHDEELVVKLAALSQSGGACAEELG